jgi:CRP-like cAMP-binding protein
VWESLWYNAFAVGMISASSMPLGSLTSLIWSPQNRTLAFLVAFGSGALLAALVIDLVGNTTEKGHYLELTIGSITGSLFFIFVNKNINNFGGFLRKPSTLLAHFTIEKERQIKAQVQRLKQVNLLQNIPVPVLRQIAEKLLVANYSQGQYIFQKGDPSENLYLINQGQVSLLENQNNNYQDLGVNESLGQDAFLTGCPHHNYALAKEDCQLGILPRVAFERLLETSPELLEMTVEALQKESLKNYLQNCHGLSLEKIQDWVKAGIAHLRQFRKIIPAVPLEENQAEFLQLARQIQRLPIFSYLPQQDLRMISEVLVYNHYSNGHVFFQPEDSSDRLYILHQGEVQIIYPTALQQPPLLLKDGDTLGELSFITGATHTVTAIATTPVQAWSIRKQDFENLLQQSFHLENSLKTFLEQPKLQEYLEKRQKLESSQAIAWIEQALQSMNAGKLIPSARQRLHQEQHSAPLSIWLGLLMDSIPEALTIGAHLAVAPLSPSLLAGVL